MSVPHLVQYQGSKRNLAHEIIKFFPKKINRLIEPFAGTASISIACASYNITQKFLINDINPALSSLLKLVVYDSEAIINKYHEIWNGQHFSENHYYDMRDIFNKSGDPAIFLYLLARCVKGSVRYNSFGNFNQSADKRRRGSSPDKIAKNIFAISSLLRNKAEFSCMDYKKILTMAKPGDLVYMDPPYQGVCGNKDNRYYSGIDFKEFIEKLVILNKKNVYYAISYDGRCGNKKYGEDLPESLGLHHVFLNAGRSAQATFLGKNHETIESLYISPYLYKAICKKN